VRGEGREDHGVDSTKARTVLDWQPRSAEDAVTATAQSLVSLGLLRDAIPPGPPVTSRQGNK